MWGRALSSQKPFLCTGLTTGGVAVLAILWGRTPALLGWALLPLLRLSIRSYTFVASLHAVAKGDVALAEGEIADDGTLLGMDFYVEGISGQIPN